MYKYISEVKVYTPKMLTTDPAELISQLGTQQSSVTNTMLAESTKRKFTSYGLSRANFVKEPITILSVQWCCSPPFVSSPSCRCKLTNVQWRASSRYIQACRSLIDKFSKYFNVAHNSMAQACLLLASYPNPTIGLGTRLVFCYNTFL